MNKKRITAVGNSSGEQTTYNMDKKTATVDGNSSGEQIAHTMDKKKTIGAGNFNGEQITFIMKKKKATAAGNSSDRQTNKEVSSTAKGAIGRRRVDIARVQSVLAIWLDSNVDERSEDCRNTVTELRHVVNAVSTFTDSDECIDFINANNNEKICMVISGSLGQFVAPLIHNMSQVDSIFIYCGNQKRHEEWTKKWPKVKGVFTEISPICEALKRAAQQYEHNATSISFLSTSGGASDKNLDQLNCSFMYTQILKEILLRSKFGQEHIDELVSYCREVFAGNDAELNNVNKFERKYREKTPIWWYTFECFLYPMLNRALRTMDMDIMIMMGFFISDLHIHIERLHAEQFGSHPQSQLLTVYRGQGLSKTDFDQLVETKGGLMAFDSFLSTSKNQNVSLGFARKAVSNPDMVGILFIMSIDPSLSSTPFASINDVSYYQDIEDEILFSMHTTFRISEIKSMGENNRLWQVDLTLTSDNDEDLRVLTGRIRDDIEGLNGWDQLGQLLLKMGQSEKAQQVYEVMLEQTFDEDEKAVIYNQIGWSKSNQGQYDEAITFYEQSLEIQQRTLPPTHPDLAPSYGNIGEVYCNMGEYSKALSYFDKVLEIQQKPLPETHPDLAACYNNIGVVYNKMGEYLKALSSHEKALEIRQKTLPSTHPNVGASYGNIGSVYYNTGEYSKALSYYEKGLEICQKALPQTHPDLAKSYIGIGTVYSNMNEYSKALLYLEKGLEIQQKTLPSTHPDLASSYYQIGLVYYDMGEYSKALSSYEKALEIRQTALPPTDPDLANSYNNIGYVYGKTAEYSKALSSHEKALTIRQKTLPPTHSDWAYSYYNIGYVYGKTGAYSKAILSHEKALKIWRKALSSTHPDLAMSYNSIGEVYDDMGEYSKARSFYEHAVDIGQHSLSTNHPHLQLYRTNLNLVKKKL